MSTHVPDASALPVRWTASSYSGGGNNCVEAGPHGPVVVAVRDSKRPAGPALLVPADVWAAFRAGLR